MSRILLIEKTGTQRHILGKILGKKGHDVVLAPDFVIGTAKLLDANERAHPFDSVVLGWPNYADPNTDKLLAKLMEHEFQPIPVLVMAPEAEPAIRDWVTRRPNTAMILWESYTEAAESLVKLLTDRSRDVETTNGNYTGEYPIRILFVDDSPTVRVFYQRLLNKNGYHTEVAADADEAIRLAMEMPFDIAIIDYFMPKINGDELCKIFKDNPQTSGITPAILTGTYHNQVIKDSLDAGAVECMFKNEAKELFLARVGAMSRMIHVKTSINNQRQRLEGILNSVGEGVYGVDTEGLINFINPAALRILGYDDESLVLGNSPYELFHFADADGKKIPQAESFMEQAYKAGYGLSSWETVFWNREKKVVPVESTIYPLHIRGKREGSVVAFSDISERKSLEKKLRWQATHDPLTELLNRRYFEDELEKEVTRLKRSREVSGLLVIDLDRFKYINDTAGHAAGDQLLIRIAHQLRIRIRDTDMLARLGGDEFAIIMRNIEPKDILSAADIFRELLQHCTFSYAGNNYKINGSVGVAVISRDTISPGEVLANADIACHLAKSKGRNQTHLYIPESDAKSDMDLDLGWSSRLREALDNDLLMLNYQPIVPVDEIDLGNLPEKDGVLWQQLHTKGLNYEGYEVLVRLHGHEDDIILPGAFIPTAERFNLMCDIDRWVLKHSIKELAKTNKRRKEIFLSINLSGQTLGDEKIFDYIKTLIREYEVNPARLTFEITETAAIANIDAARKLVYELNAMGCHFALDDFGSGFSSFTHLKNLLVEKIKIDGSFVQGIASDPMDHTMVVSMNDIAHSLSRRTIAEYVENAAILRLLKDMGVDYVQGFYVSPPLKELPIEPGKVIQLEQKITAKKA